MKKVLLWMLVGMLILNLVACNSTAENLVANTENEINEAIDDNKNNEVENNTGVSNEMDQEEPSQEQGTTEEEPVEYQQIPLIPEELAQDERPIVTIELEDGQKILLKLVPEIAPNTVNSFIELIESGYYDGIIFHRIIENFMIQGGDPDGLGTGGPGYTIRDEFYVLDEAARTITFLPHFRGVLSMAKTAAPDSAGSQFFIVHQDAHHLNGQYAAFGFVVEGMEVIDALASVETDGSDKPLEDIVMKKVTVDLKGYQAEEPIKIQ